MTPRCPPQLVKRRKGSFLDDAKLHELTFGCVPPASSYHVLPERTERPFLCPFRTAPPHLRVCRSRFNPASRYLQLEAELVWETEGFQALFDVSARPLPRLPALRLPLALRGLSLRGRVLLGFALAPAGVGAAPGISRIDGSFAEPPRFDVRLEALGLPLGDVPGVEAWTRRQLSVLLQERFVEPRRATVNAPRAYAKATLAKRRGPGGTLVVIVASAEHLAPGEDAPLTAGGGKQAPLVDAGAPSCYVELRYAGWVRRTPVAPQRRSPAWGATLAFPVPASAAGVDAGQLRLAVVHWAAPGAPAQLGETAPVPITPRDLAVHAGAPLHSMAMPLLGPGAPRGATVHIRVGILPPGAEEYALALAAEAGAERDAAMRPSPHAPRSSTNGHHHAQFSLSDWDPSMAEMGPPETAEAPEVGPHAHWVADGRRRLSSPEVVAPVASGVVRSASAASLVSTERLSNGSGSGAFRPPMHPPAVHGGSGGSSASRAAALTHAKAAAGDAARDLLSTLAAPGGGGQGGVGAKLPQLTQAVSRLASAAVVAAQAAAAEPGDLQQYDAGGPADRHPAIGERMPPGALLLRASSPNGRAPSNMDRLLAAGARAVDAAVAAANAGRNDSHGPSPGHSRGESWDDAASWRGGGHHRSGSADSAADAALMYSHHSGGRGASGALSDAPPGGISAGGDMADLQRRLLEAQRRVRELEAALSLEAQLREAEDVRALVEGARFVLHTPQGAKTKFVWFNAQKQRICWAASAERRSDAAERAKHFVPLAAVEGVEAGAALFDAAMPGSGGGASWLGGRPAPPPRDARAAFSVLVASDAHARPGGGGSDAAGTFPAALHLELPPGGNGRSGREWVSAFATVVKRGRAGAAAPAAAGALLSSALGAIGQRMNGGSQADRNGATPSCAAAAALALLDAGAQRSGAVSGTATPQRLPATPDARRVLRLGDDEPGGSAAHKSKGSADSLATSDDAHHTPPQ